MEEKQKNAQQKDIQKRKVAFCHQDNPTTNIDVCPQAGMMGPTCMGCIWNPDDEF